MEDEVEIYDSSSKIAYFVLVHGAAHCLFIVLVLRGLDQGPAAAGTAFLSLAAMTGLVLAALRAVQGRFAGVRPALLAIMLGGLGGYALPLLAFLSPALALGLSAGLGSLGVRLAAARTWRGEGALGLLVISLAAVASAAVLFVLLNGLHYAHIFTREFVLLGWQAGDTVFHSAIASLFATYGVPTTGLNGTPPLFYHAGSHVIIGAFSALSGQTVLASYPAVQQLFFIPALLLAWSLLAAFLCGFRARAAIFIPLGVLACWHLYEWYGAYNSFLLSESYAFSLGVFALALPVLLAGPRPTWTGVALWALLLAPSAAVSIAGKFTLALAWCVFASAGLWMALGDRRVRTLRAVLVGMLLLGYLGLVFAMYLKVGGMDAAGFFSYARTYPKSYQASLGIIALGTIALVVAGRNRVTFLTPVVLLLAGILLHLPDVVMSGGAGSAYYWFHPADMVAGAALVAALVALPGRVPSAIRLSAAGLAVAAIVFAATRIPGFIPQASTFANTLIVMDRLAKEGRVPEPQFELGGRSHAYARALIAPDLPDPWADRGYRALARAGRVVTGALIRGSDGALSQVVRQTPLALAAAAVDTQLESREARDPALVYVAPDAAWMWNYQVDCTARHFAFQAVTGLALAAGVPGEDGRCPPLSGFGMGGYGSDSRNRMMTGRELCALAGSKGFGEIIAIDASRNIQIHDCPT